eukprot:gene6266-7271_t
MEPVSVKEKSTIVVYLDDQGFNLKNQSYILRLIRGVNDSEAKATFKYRVASDNVMIDDYESFLDGNQADNNITASAPPVRVEQDIVGYHENVIGNNVGYLSLKQDHHLNINTSNIYPVSHFSELFPKITRLGLEPDTTLSPVGGEILSIKMSPGHILVKDSSKIKFDMAVWYQHPDQSLIVGEISFKINNESMVDSGKLIFNELQRCLQSDLMESTTKTSTVYRIASDGD